MKKYFTLFILLLVCLNLSALVYRTGKDHLVYSNSKIDTPKTAGKAILKDTAKIKPIPVDTGSASILASLSRKDSAVTSPVAVHNDSISTQPFPFHPDSLDMASILMQADSLKAVEAIKLTDSLYVQAIIQKQDSVKWNLYKLHVDSVRKDLKAMSLDSLKIELKIPENNMYKGPIYGELSDRYMQFDTISNKRTRQNYQIEALSYTMKSLHQYSYFNDTLGLRTAFDNLSKVYLAQKKYSQAKWFVLQSNSLSRAKKDQVNIIASLVLLSTVKAELNDYTLAMRDLDEALQISETYHYPKLESDILRHYGLLYSRLKNYPKEELVLKKRDLIEEAMKKDEENKLLAADATKDSMENRKADSLQVKKKVITSNTKKLYKNNSAKKVATL